MGCTQSTTAQEQAPLSGAPTSNVELDSRSLNGELEVDDNGKLDIEEIGISGYKVSSNGIVMYSVFVKGSSGAVPHCVSKRYNDFKALHAAIFAVMGNILPDMPKGDITTLFNRKNESLMQDRKQAFEEMMSICAKNNAVKESELFRKFLE